MTHPIFTRIESPSFAAELNLASSMSLADRVLEVSEATRALREMYAHEDSFFEDVLERIEQLAQVDIDPRYENPYDAALCAYLWTMDKLNPELGLVAAELVAHSRQTWWARQFATRILARESEMTRDSQATVQLSMSSGAQAVTANVNSQTTSGPWVISNLARGVYRYVVGVIQHDQRNVGPVILLPEVFPHQAGEPVPVRLEQTSLSADQRIVEWR